MTGAAYPSGYRAVPVLSARGLSRSFVSQRGGLLRKTQTFRAVDDVSLTIHRGETLAVVGESGCGKSTLGKLLIGLLPASAGRVVFDDRYMSALSPKAWRASRRRVQVIFQDAAGSLDPRLPVFDQVREPLEIHKIGTPETRTERARAMLSIVRLGAHLWESVPGELSGGQQQRVVIARALILEPDLLVCDEPVSALDVSIQAQIVNLLTDLRQRFGIAMLFISHDLAVVRHIADRVAVMYLGQIVEEGETRALYDAPAHPYTRALLSAIPVPDPDAPRRRQILGGDPPSPQSPPSGCRFHTRCPLAAARCATDAPQMIETGGRRVACHFPELAP